MNEIAKRIAKAMEQQNISYGELANVTGIPKSAVFRYVTGQTEKLPLTRLVAIAKALHVEPSYLMGWEVIPSGFQAMPETNNATPLIGDIACGTPILAEENIRDYIPTPKNWRADFALECHGDSMVPKIQDGDIVAIRKQAQVDNGQIAAVRINDEATLKRVYLSSGQLVLQAENRDYAPIVLSGEAIKDAEIEGLAVGIMRNI